LEILQKAGKTKEDYDKKEAELGAENMKQLEKVVCLRVLDLLWQEHLSYMDHVRDSVRLRAYSGRDPLVEYKNEGHKAFGQLLATIDADISENVLKAGISRQNTPSNDGARTIMSGHKEPGRNDECPCGSGKKWKKCGMLNTEEHQKLMAQKK
jgi:preprotein translocase subunit SecA